MLRFNFNKLSEQLRFYPLEYKKLCDNYIKCARKSKSINIEDLWKYLEKICNSLSPIYVDILNKMKPDIFMSLYTAVTYTISKPISKNDLITAFLEADTTNTHNPDDIRRRLAQASSDLKSPKAIKYYACQNSNFNNVQYLLSYRNSDNQELKVFNSLDFYFYITNYKHWPFFYDNRKGMFFYEWYKSMWDIFTHASTDEQFANISIEPFAQEHSAYIFEHIFHPAHFMKNVDDFLENFRESFFNYDSSQRKKIIISTIPLAYLPIALQDNLKNLYFLDLKSYMDNPDDPLKQFTFKKQLERIFLYKGILFPFAETILSYLLQSIFTFGPYIYLEQIQKLLKNYITENIEQYNYHSIINSSFNTFKNTYYPSKQETSKSILLSEKTEKKRNNIAIKTFELDFTYNFFSLVPLNDILYCQLYWNRHFTPEEYLQISSKRIFDLINSDNISPLQQILDI